VTAPAAHPGITRIAGVGAGYMGGGIASAFAMSGIDVVLTDVDPSTTARSLERIIDQAQDFARSGLYTETDVEHLREHITVVRSIEEAVANAEYVTEAVPEDPDIKREVLTRIGDAAPKTTIIGTNTSALPIGELAKAVPRPERFLGVHWMNPAQFVPGVEIIAAERTSPAVVDIVEELLGRVGKATARVTDSPGFVANRLQFALYKEAVRIVEEGLATPDQVDAVVSNTFGFRLALFGPFAIADMAGLDVYAASYATLARHFGERFEAPVSLTERVASGDAGMKTGGGFLNIDPALADDLVNYRNRAYQSLMALRRSLGSAPGLSAE
jgi:3-hydroxybutyryl-CoA dehydrogenase